METSYPVYLPESFSGKKVVVYYASSESGRQHFRDSVKYNRAIRGQQWVFIDDLLSRKKDKKISLFKKPTIKTNYPVYLSHPKTKKKTIVYYAKDNNQRDRFITSSKFNNAYNVGWDFE